MQFKDDLMGESFFTIHRVGSGRSGNICGQEKIFVNKSVFDGHDLAVHVIGGIVQPDGVAPAFAHLAAVGAHEKLERHNKRFFVSELLLQGSAGLHIEGLVGAANLNVHIHEI